MQTCNVLFACAAMVSLAACASPKVYDEVHHMDHRLSCSMMEHEIREMEKHKMSVDESKGVTVRNVLTTALFFPVTMATYSNVDEAQDASSARQKHLMGLYASKGCADEGPRARYSMMMAPVSHRYVERVDTTEPEPRVGSRYSNAHIHSASYLFK